MFSLKFDLLFPVLMAVKKIAGQLNDAPPAIADPRDLRRMRKELRLAREKRNADLVRRRYHMF